MRCRPFQRSSVPVPGAATAPLPVTTTRRLLISTILPHPSSWENRSLQAPHSLQPAVVVIRLVLEELLHLGMGEDEEPLTGETGHHLVCHLLRIDGVGQQQILELGC